MTFLLSGGALPVAAAGVLIAFAVCYAVATRTGRGRRWWRLVAQLLWLSALAGVGYLTLVLANPDGGGLNLVPFHTINSQLRNLSLTMAAFNILGNILVLVPFGLLARPAWGWGWLRTTVAAGLCSTMIEIAQGITGRSADIDDVLLNTAGAAAGALVSLLIVVVADRLDPPRLTRRPEPATQPDDSEIPTVPVRYRR